MGACHWSYESGAAQSLNQRNNTLRSQAGGHCVTNDFASSLWITPLNKVYLQVIPRGKCLSTLHHAIRLNIPTASPPPTSVTSVRRNMIYHTNIPFSNILIALISLLIFPIVSPACIFHVCPVMESLNSIHHKNIYFTVCLQTHFYFLFYVFRADHCLSLHTHLVHVKTVSSEAPG